MVSKAMRQNVYNKYNGHCAYCGCHINYKDMQVDHIVPNLDDFEVGEIEPQGNLIDRGALLSQLDGKGGGYYTDGRDQRLIDLLNSMPVVHR